MKLNLSSGPTKNTAHPPAWLHSPRVVNRGGLVIHGVAEKHTGLGERHNSRCSSLNSRLRFGQMMFSCWWNVSVYRRDGETERSPTRLPASRLLRGGRLSVQKSATLHESHISHFHSRRQARALSLLCSIYRGGICWCHADVNIYPWRMLADFLQSKKTCGVLTACR